MSSAGTTTACYTLTVTFELGTDLDIAQVLVQNRVNRRAAAARGGAPARASPREELARSTMVVHLVSPDGRYDQLYLRNYALLQVQDVLARCQAWATSLLRRRDYSMRIWLDPGKIAARNLTAGDVVAGAREQNVQVAAGSIGQPPSPSRSPFQFTVNTQGRLLDEEEFGEIVIRTGGDGQLTRLRDVARIELGAPGLLAALAAWTTQPAVADRHLPAARLERLAAAERVRATMAELTQNFPEGSTTRSSTTRRRSSASRSARWSRPCSRR